MLRDGAAAGDKAAKTRERILEAALQLFRERGYERTTMRAIATAASVSLGNAYYYFESKEHLIQAFYLRTHLEHVAACAEILESESDLKTRLLGVMRAKLGTSMPYHRFSGLLFKTAADPASPLNPFSRHSEPTRREVTVLFEQVVAGSTTRIPSFLREELAELLWLYQMGVILYWIHDDSPGCDHSYRLVEKSVDLLVRVIRLSANPALRPLIRSGLKLVAELRGATADTSRGT